MDSRWHLYQGALVWNGNPREAAPTQQAACEAVNESGAMFARWTSDFDCGYSTEWWHCIKDTPFDLQKISAKHRYVIKQGLKNFEVLLIDNPQEYAEDIFKVDGAAFSVYPIAYRPILDRERHLEYIRTWKGKYVVFGAFSRETNELCGYARLLEKEHRIIFEQQKTIPSMEKLQVNAALVYAVVMHYNDRLSPDFYIVDGERNIKHETNFFQYLIKYFEFRLAYCKLNIEYNKRIKLIINLLYPFRDGIKLLRSCHPLINNVYCVLRQEEIRKSFK